jgi:processive 1,2-diacylglycerol beta-glucosyltransferase
VELRRRHQLDPDARVLLILCGGFGVGPVEELVHRVALALRGVQVVVIAGRNRELEQRLSRWAAEGAARLRVLGFTTEMHEWMALADLAISKPGGLTTSEALACGLPLVVAHAIPGQETRNATMLYESGAAISGENPHTIAHRVASLLDSPARLAAMRRAARRLARPRAALQVAAQVLELSAWGPASRTFPGLGAPGPLAGQRGGVGRG